MELLSGTLVAVGFSKAIVTEAAVEPSLRLVSDFRNFNHPTGPEELTLAEEFVLLWDEPKNEGELEGGPMIMHSPLTALVHPPNYAAVLMPVSTSVLGLIARGRIKLEEEKQAQGIFGRVTEKTMVKVLDGTPVGINFMDAVLKEMVDRPGGKDHTLMWWLQHWTTSAKFTNMVCDMLVAKGILREEMIEHFMGKSVKYPIAKPEVRERIVAKLVGIMEGTVPPDARSVIILDSFKEVDVGRTKGIGSGMTGIEDGVMLAKALGSDALSRMGRRNAAAKIDELKEALTSADAAENYAWGNSPSVSTDSETKAACFLS